MLCSSSLRVLFLCLLSCVTCSSVDDYEMDDTVEDAVKEEIEQLTEWLVEGQKAAVPWSSLCPPPVNPMSKTACNAKPCSASSECAPRHNNTYLCCYNGCLDTCMRALDPPPVFDWIEEPPDVKKLIVGGGVASHSSSPELVALPGGCVITPQQLLSLEGFKQNEHVSECFCHAGGVFCKIIQ